MPNEPPIPLKEKAPIRYPQIDYLNAQRPKPQLLLEMTPSGPAWTKVLTKEAELKNRQLDQRIEQIRETISQQRGRARDAFNRAR